jgi:polar amino acid transport system substrate-binding protein
MQIFAKHFIHSLMIVLVLMAARPVSAAPLEILVEDANAPWSNHGGTGYVNEAIKDAFMAVGVPVILKVVPYARCKALVLAGKGVACASMSWSPELAGYIQFAAVPFYTTHFDYYQRKLAPTLARSEKELGRGAVIGVVNSYEYPPSAYQSQQRGAIFQNGRSDKVNLQKLAKGRLNFALITTNNFEPRDLKSQQAGVEYEVVYAFSGDSLPTYIGFSTHHAQGLLALEKFNEGYKIITKNGALARLKSKWFASSSK